VKSINVEEKFEENNGTLEKDEDFQELIKTLSRLLTLGLYFRSKENSKSGIVKPQLKSKDLTQGLL